MAKIVKSDITSLLDNGKNNTFNSGLVWTNSNPAHSGIASWFENANTTAASLSTSSNKITASTLVNDIGTFVSKFTNVRKITYTQQYTKVTLNSDGNPIGSEVITESTTTNKGALSSTGASNGGVTYKPTISADSSKIVKNSKILNSNVTDTVNDAITKWTNNYNSTVSLTYNRGEERWTNHSQRGRR